MLALIRHMRKLENRSCDFWIVIRAKTDGWSGGIGADSSLVRQERVHPRHLESNIHFPFFLIKKNDYIGFIFLVKCVVSPRAL